MFIIRNDDVAFDSSLDNIKWFCETCDKYGFKILHAITPIGAIIPIEANWTNDEIRERCGDKLFIANERVYSYFRWERNDLIAVHGLYHTHIPPDRDVFKAYWLLRDWGFNPEYFVPPFNEGDYFETILRLKVSSKDAQWLEGMLGSGTPTSEIVYLHSWRFNCVGNQIPNVNCWYKREDLEKCLDRLSKEGK